ncbi:TonB-dependent receptor [Echinicola sp. 20G]|uniref:TonB-dependent receptor n=1 Tax=Echinicola sp. 20G TaxID=2781961 RepID=UPI0019100060|nr:TonB-dependent receptor [Echinicola sp. 20G]
MPIRLLLMALFLLTAQLSFGQSMSITGTVVDPNGSLPGAMVYIKGTQTGGTSDISGNFQILNHHTGDQTLVISFIGYNAKEVPLSVEAGKDINLGLIEMEEESTGLSEVVVKGTYYPSQMRAISMKKSSNAISEVLAADAIGKLPDRNAAEAVQRMQGVSIERDMGEGRRVIVRGAPTHWTSITLNGNRLPSAGGASDERYTQLDVFPSELIQYVQLNKALTPDIDGDAIGGSMNFITKSSPSDQLISATVAGGYNTNAKSPSYNTSLIYGDRIGEKFGFIASAVVWDRTAGIDRYGIGYNFSNPDPVQSFSMNNLQLRDYVARRRTAGFNLGMDYDISPNSKIYFKGLYSQYLDQQKVREAYFNFDNNNAQLQARHADYVTNLYSMKAGGEFNISHRLKLDASYQISSSDFKLNSPDNLPEDERGYPIVNFVQPMTYEGLSSDGFKYLAMDSPEGIGGSLENVPADLGAPLDPNSMRLNQIILQQMDKKETDHTGQFDFTHQTNDKLQLKFGGKLLNKEREFNSSATVKMQGALLGIPNSPDMLFLSDMETESTPYDGTFLNELGDVYDEVNISQITNDQIDAMYTDEFATQNGLITVLAKDAPSNAPQSYTGQEQVISAYAMGTYQVNEKLELIGGIRNEVNHLEFTGARVLTDQDGSTVEEVTSTKDYNAFLPMVHLKMKPNNNTIVRAAYTRTYARPTFNRLNPGVQINNLTQTITEGNTELDPTFSNNYDLAFEYYPEELGIFSAGIFYKDLSNYIYDDQSIEVYNDLNYLRSRPENLESAWLYGIELSYVKRFTNMDNFMKNFGVELNYSYIDSEVEIPTFTEGEQTGSYKTSLPEQANHIGNAIVFYENNKFMARLAGNFKGKYVNAIRSIAGPEHYRWFGNNFTVDFSSSYLLSDNFRLFVELNNITNAPNRYYHGVSDRPEEAAWSGIRGQIGLSFNLR